MEQLGKKLRFEIVFSPPKDDSFSIYLHIFTAAKNFVSFSSSPPPPPPPPLHIGPPSPVEMERVWF